MSHQTEETIVRYVRITCLPINAPTERPITIDAVLDENDEICGNQPLFGLWGRMNHDQDSYSPLVLRGDGVIDYGHVFDPLTERYFAFDLRAGKISVNRLLSYKSRDRSIVVSYLIDDVSDLTVPKPNG
jgi:hypothetical protein